MWELKLSWSYVRFQMYIVKTMIVKVATDTTAAIIMMFFILSDGFWPSSLFKPLVVEFVEELFALTFFVIDTGFETIVSVVVALVVVAVVVVDVLGVCVVDANRVIGSWIKKNFVNTGFKILNSGRVIFYKL